MSSLNVLGVVSLCQVCPLCRCFEPQMQACRMNTVSKVQYMTWYATDCYILMHLTRDKPCKLKACNQYVKAFLKSYSNSI